MPGPVIEVPIERCQPDRLPTYLTRAELQRYLRCGQARAFEIMRAHGEKLGSTWRLRSSKIPEILKKEEDGLRLSIRCGSVTEQDS